MPAFVFQSLDSVLLHHVKIIQADQTQLTTVALSQQSLSNPFSVFYTTVAYFSVYEKATASSPEEPQDFCLSTEERGRYKSK